LGLLCLGLVAGCGEANRQSAVEVAQQYNFSVTGEPSVTTTVLSPALADPPWAWVDAACREGGFDLAPHLGKPVTMTSYATRQAYYSDLTISSTVQDALGMSSVTVVHPVLPLDLTIISGDGSTLCVYASADNLYALDMVHSGLLPSLDFAVNDPHIR